MHWLIFGKIIFLRGEIKQNMVVFPFVHRRASTVLKRFSLMYKDGDSTAILLVLQISLRTDSRNLDLANP